MCTAEEHVMENQYMGELWQRFIYKSLKGLQGMFNIDIWRDVYIYVNTCRKFPSLTHLACVLAEEAHLSSKGCLPI